MHPRYDGTAGHSLRFACARVGNSPPPLLGSCVPVDAERRHHSTGNRGTQQRLLGNAFKSHTGTDEHEADRIIVRSNGTVTYTGKDIAYQLWKLGHLGLDFNYKPFRSYEDGSVVWVTTTEPNSAVLPELPRPNFGGGVTVYNVIDSRQSYPQEIVSRGVAALVPEVGERASIHLAYEKVALSPTACEELGIELSDNDRGKPYIEMSGRKGLGVKADDLIDRLRGRCAARG